jgi:hypothetical protein
MRKTILHTIIGAAFLLVTGAMASTTGPEISEVTNSGESPIVAEGEGFNDPSQPAITVSATSQSEEGEPALAAADEEKPAAVKKSVTVNAGTAIMVRTQTSLVTGKVSSGDRFTATTEGDLLAGNTVVAPRGSTVYGRVSEAKKAGRLAGRAKLVIELTDILIDGQTYPLVTESIGYEGHRSGTLKKLGLGAAVGGIADGSDGARTGAAVGAGVAVLTKGKQIHVPSGSVLQFRMNQPLQVSQ